MKRHFERYLLLILPLALSWGPLFGADDGFKTLFNGRDLSGWVEMGAPGAFFVDEGTLFLGNPQNYPNWLRTEKRYENFVLRLEYMVPGWSETGILLHAPIHGRQSKAGLKIHLRHDQMEEGARSTGAVYDVLPPIRIANNPPKEWNQMEIYLNWPRLRVKLNGDLVQNVNMELNPEMRHRLRNGYIGLQDTGTRIRYRNLQIRELPGQEAWQTLFDGETFQGWTREGEASWEIQDGIIVASGGDGTLTTDESFSSYHLKLYIRTSTHANGGIFFRYRGRQTGRGHYEAQIYNVIDATNPTGSIYGIVPALDPACRDQEWCLMEIISEGAHAAIRVNGETVAESHTLELPDEGKIVLQMHSQGQVEFKDIQIKPIGGDDSVGP